jgi:glycosyltransferase involved in cell wall biosynthesis
MNYPKISILIPTLNAESVLRKCLESIARQDYPKEMLEILIADGGSSDSTLEVAREFGCVIIDNPLKTGEAGKMIALKKSSGKFCALIDSDNILPHPIWLKNMIEPLLLEEKAVGSEPLYYTWREEDGFITRYCALLGMNDPLVLFLGNYDRYSVLTGKWTEVPCVQTDKGKYLQVTFNKKVPTIGANGTIFRKEFLIEHAYGDYLFDIDILTKELRKTGKVEFIKVKEGIVHSYCESDIGKFIRKQKRRVLDMMYHKFNKKDRSYDWFEMDIFGKEPWGILKFILFGVAVVPLLAQTLMGYLKKKDRAWFFHPLACEITLVVYGWFRLFGRFYQGEYDRRKWGQ